MTKIIQWAKQCLLSNGYIINNPPEYIRTTPWSKVIRFFTTNGYVYLKQTPPTLSLEPRIIQIISNQVHANVPIVIDINQKLYCFLMKDAGNSLRESLQHHFQTDLLCHAIKKYTYIQRAITKQINTFLALGVPDWQLEKLPMLYEQLIGQKEIFQEDGMTIDELHILHKLSPKFSSMCALLSHHKIPATLDHCDFHDNNILIENNTNNITIIDWGETVIAHPFFSMVSCLNNAAYRYTLKETDDAYIKLQDACLENWLGFTSQDNLLEAIFLTKRLWPIYSSLGFYRLMMSSNTKGFKSYADQYFTPLGRLTGFFREFIKINTL